MSAISTDSASIPSTSQAIPSATTDEGLAVVNGPVARTDPLPEADNALAIVGGKAPCATQSEGTPSPAAPQTVNDSATSTNDAVSSSLASAPSPSSDKAGPVFVMGPPFLLCNTEEQRKDAAKKWEEYVRHAAEQQAAELAGKSPKKIKFVDPSTRSNGDDSALPQTPQKPIRQIPGTPFAMPIVDLDEDVDDDPEESFAENESLANKVPSKFGDGHADATKPVELGLPARDSTPTSPSSTRAEFDSLESIPIAAHSGLKKPGKLEREPGGIWFKKGKSGPVFNATEYNKAKDRVNGRPWTHPFPRPGNSALPRHSPDEVDSSPPSRHALDHDEDGQDHSPVSWPALQQYVDFKLAEQDAMRRFYDPSPSSCASDGRPLEREPAIYGDFYPYFDVEAYKKHKAMLHGASEARPVDRTRELDFNPFAIRPSSPYPRKRSWTEMDEDDSHDEEVKSSKSKPKAKKNVKGKGKVRFEESDSDDSDETEERPAKVRKTGWGMCVVQ